MGMHRRPRLEGPPAPCPLVEEEDDRVQRGLDQRDAGCDRDRAGEGIAHPETDGEMQSGEGDRLAEISSGHRIQADAKQMLWCATVMLCSQLFLFQFSNFTDCRT